MVNVDDLGVAQDYEEAIKWWKKDVDLGNVDAMVKISARIRGPDRYDALGAWSFKLERKESSTAKNTC